MTHEIAIFFETDDSVRGKQVLALCESLRQLLTPAVAVHVEHQISGDPLEGPIDLSD